jgi:peptide/nickel transport system substrate-binding protein
VSRHSVVVVTAAQKGEENVGVRQKSRTRGASRFGWVLASVSLVAVACSSGGHSGGSTATSQAKLTPKAGGSLTIGTEAEVTTGFDPFNSDWDATGLSYAATVYDPLTALADDGTFKPYLAESLTPNTDFTAWKIKARSGITFTNGEPFNGDAMKMDFDALLASPLTGPVLNNIASVTKVDDMTVQVNMQPKSHCPTCGPWTVFPQYMASQLGFMVAPAAIKDPNRAHNPIGTGPFKFKEWNVGDHFTAVKNPNYWRKDANGNPLPYLDSVTFKPLVDSISRENSLKGGSVDMIHTSDSQNVVDFRGDSSVHLIEQHVGRVEEDFIMLNVTKAPLDDIRIRRALAMSLDQNKYNTIINNGIDKLANGPYSDGSGFTNSTNYPKYDPAGARALVQAYEADHHTNNVTFEFGTTNNGRNLQANRLIADMWKTGAGITANVVQIEQSSYILNAVTGSFQAYGWRQFGEPDPDGDVTWWASDKTQPPLATNFARNKDPKIDSDLAAARQTTDQALRKQLYTDVSQQLNADIPFIWTNQVLWAYVAKPNVQGIEIHTLPDGSPARALLSGVIVPTQLWVNQ